MFQVNAEVLDGAWDDREFLDDLSEFDGDDKWWGQGYGGSWGEHGDSYEARGEFDPSLFVMGVEADAGIPAFSTIRSHILQTLSPSDVVNASGLHEHWYHAAADPQLWRGIYASSKSNALSSGDLSFEFPSPVMYQLVEDVALLRQTDIELLCSDELSSFVKGASPIFTIRGCWLYTMATLHTLCRSPPFVLGHRDNPARDDCMLDSQHRYFLLLTQALTAQTTCPRPSALPWLLSLYEWVASSPSAAHMGFDKLMLAPASFVLRSEVCPPLPQHVRSVILTTTRIIERFVKGRYLVIPSSSYIGSPNMLPQQDPRHAYGIYVHALLKFPEFSGLVEREVVDNFGDVGVFELECARARVMVLLGAASLRNKEMLEVATAEHPLCPRSETM